MDKIEWQAPEYIHTEKSTDWYWIVGIISISIAIISIILNNFIFGILIIISAVTLSLYATRRPETVWVEIDNRSIIINETVHLFEDIDSFWVETRDAYPRVFIRLKKKISMYVVIMMGNADPEEVREKLSRHIPETEHTEPLLEKVLLYLGF